MPGAVAAPPTWAAKEEVLFGVRGEGGRKVHPTGGGGPGPLPSRPFPAGPRPRPPAPRRPMFPWGADPEKALRAKYAHEDEAHAKRQRAERELREEIQAIQPTPR